MQDATAKGYEVVQFPGNEVRLVRGGRGICSWSTVAFDNKLPGLDHPKIKEAIRVEETWQREHQKL